mgnify:CR=1 FL=1
MSDQIEAVITAVVIALVALVGIVITAPIVGVVSDSTVSVEQAIEPQVGESVTVTSGSTDRDVTVRATRENAVQFDGTGYVDATPPPGWNNDSWSVTAVATPDTSDGSAFNPDATHNVIAVNNSTFRVDWANGYWAAVYERGGESARVQVPATATQTPIVVTFNGSSDELAIEADGNRSAATLDTNTNVRRPSLNWVGTIDEVRYIDGQLSSGQVDTYQADPIDPLAGADHTARWLFDEGSGSTSVGYYNGSTAELIGAGWGAGVAGPDLDAGTDYELTQNPLAIVALDGGYLDGAPVVFINTQHPLAGTVDSITTGLTDAYVLIPVVLLGLIASVALAAIARLQQ